MDAYYLFEENITKEEAYLLYVNQINNDIRYDKLINDNLLTIEEKYIPYYFFDCAIYNHSYFYHNKVNDIKKEGKIDVIYNQVDKDFILNELNRTSAKKIEKCEFDLYNTKKYEDSYHNFLKGIKDKFLQSILNYHSINLSKNIHIDVSPIDSFDSFECNCYYEKIFVFRYATDINKKDYISILSAYNKRFYCFEYVHTADYDNYLSKNKKPIEYIPKRYLDLYYSEAYQAYVFINKSLEYETKEELLQKIKRNSEYEDYSYQQKYLKLGIYYFKNKKYLKKLKNTNSSLINRIFNSYLTLRFQKDSGIFLHQCASLGLLDDISINDKINYLYRSYRLKNVEAKKLLYEHYTSKLYYNELLAKKYS